MNTQTPIALVAGALALMWSGAALAQDTTLTEARTARIGGYCDWITGSADARRMLLMSPALTLRAGPVQAGSEETGDENLALNAGLRLSVGARYSLTNLHRAGLIDDEAQAICRRYRAKVHLEDFTKAQEDIGQAQALDASIALLESALPKAKGYVERVRDDLEQQNATLTQLHASELRLKRLKARISDLKLARARLDDKAPSPAPSGLSAHLDALHAAERDIEAARASLRTASAWDVSVSAGYDEIFGTDRGLPFFATLQLSFNLGRLWQDSANERARTGLDALHANAPSPARERLDEIARVLRATREVESERLAEVRILIKDLEGRMAQVSAIDSAASRRHHEALWFEHTDLASKRAHLEALIESIDAYLGQAPEATTSTLDVTLGHLKPAGSDRFRVEAAKMRAVTSAQGGRQGRLDFVYQGPSRDTAPLGSGAVQRQIGLKLLARDGCNLLYVMWRIEPVPELFVASKLNPGATRHTQCGTGGYQRLKASTRATLPTIKPGEAHRLEARVQGSTLIVEADGKQVWSGPVPAAVLAIEGHTGVRSDNGVFDFSLLTE